MSNGSSEVLFRLEEQYWQAIKDQDVETCVELSADPVLVTGAQGVGSFAKQQMREMMEQNQQYTLETFALKDVKARMITPDLGIIAYTVHEKLTVEGKPIEFIAADTSTWVRRNGKWECVMHTESILGDPFGRDKMKNAGEPYG